MLALPVATYCTVTPSHIVASDVCGSTNTLAVAVHAV